MRILYLLLFLLSPVIVFASEGDPLMGFVWRLITFVIFSGILYFFLHNTIKSSLDVSIATIKDAIGEAEKSKEKAMLQLADYTRQVEKLEKELANLSSSARASIEKEVEEIMANASASAENIKTMAKHSIEIELERAKNSIRKEVVRQSILLAEKKFLESDNSFKSNFIKSNIDKMGVS